MNDVLELAPANPTVDVVRRVHYQAADALENGAQQQLDEVTKFRTQEKARLENHRELIVKGLEAHRERVLKAFDEHRTGVLASFDEHAASALAGLDTLVTEAQAFREAAAKEADDDRREGDETLTLLQRRTAKLLARKRAILTPRDAEIEPATPQPGPAPANEDAEQEERAA